MKKISTIIFLALTLFGCASFQPQEGMTFASFQSMSIKSFNGAPINLSRQGDLVIYVLPNANRDLSKQGNLIAKALYDPSKDMAYFFSASTDKLVRMVPINQIGSVVSADQQAKRGGFASLADFDYAKSIDASANQLQQLKGLGVSSESEYRVAKLDELKSQSLYNNKSDVASVIQFLIDRRAARQAGITLEEAVKRRMAPQLAREAEAKRQYELLRQQEAQAKSEQEKAAAAAAAKAAAAKSVLGL